MAPVNIMGSRAAHTSPIGKASIANDKCSESENNPKVPPPIPLIGRNEPTSQDIAIAEPTKGKATRASFIAKLDAPGRDRESIGKIITGVFRLIAR